MGAIHNTATKTTHATTTRTNLLANGDPLLQVTNSSAEILVEVDPIALSAMGAGALEDWQFNVTGLPVVKEAIKTGTAAWVVLCDGNGDMVTKIAAAGLVSPLAIVSGKNVQFNSIVYSGV
jgi:hypothetical protein